MKNINLGLHATTTLRYKFEVVRKGKVIRSLPWRDNMITDDGLNQGISGNSSMLTAFAYPIIGDGVSPTPVRHDSGSITFTQSGNVVTGSSGFFALADVGRLFKYGTGSAGVEQYITGFTDDRHVTVTSSATVSTPTVATIWYVNTSNLANPLTSVSWSKLNDALQNNSAGNVVGNACIVTHNTTWFSSPMTSAKTISEIGFNYAYYVGSNLYDRDIISPTVALLTGDQAKVSMQLIVNYSPVTTQAVANFATGYNSAGDYLIESLGFIGHSGIHYFNSSGGIAGGTTLEPGSTPGISVYMQTFTQAAFDLVNPIIDNTITKFYSSVAAPTYGTGNYYKDYVGTLSISQANGTIYGVAVCDGGYNCRSASLKFATPFTKNSTQALTYKLRKSWSRVLTN